MGFLMGLFLDASAEAHISARNCHGNSCAEQPCAVGRQARPLSEVNVVLS
jgi:hypothetical protein